jgi:hypothetical protein
MKFMYHDKLRSEFSVNSINWDTEEISVKSRQDLARSYKLSEIA